MQPELSVVIPTFNRAQLLRENLRALLDQSLDKQLFEIIIVDDGSNDGTAEAIAELRSHTSHHLRMYQEENKLAGCARNLGIKKARGAIILLIDDDITPNQELLQRHLELHQKYPELELGVLGRVITGNTGMDLCNPDSRIAFPIGTTKLGDPLVDAASLRTANLSLKKDFIEEAGLFIEGLPCFQDNELAFRLKKRGLRLIFCQEAIGIHREPTDTVEKVMKRGKKYGRAAAEWYDRIPELREMIISAGRLNEGGRHFISDPMKYLRNAIRRWTINRYTIGLILEIAQRIPITRPPNKILVRFCLEIFAYYYRHEFQRGRQQLHKEKAGSK